MENNKTLKPYLVEAFYKWSLAHNLTPLIEVAEDYYNLLPNNVKKQNIAILNIHPEATHDLIIGKQFIEFEALFNGESFNVKISYESIQKVFVKEDGYGLEFSVDINKIKTPYLAEANKPKIVKKHLKLIKK